MGKIGNRLFRLVKEMFGLRRDEGENVPMERGSAKRPLCRSLEVHQAWHLRRLKEWQKAGVLNEKEHRDLMMWLLDVYDGIRAKEEPWSETSWRWEIPSNLVLPSGHAFMLLQSFKERGEKQGEKERRSPLYSKYFQRGFVIPSFEALGEILAAREDIQALFATQVDLLALRTRQEMKARTKEKWSEGEQIKMKSLRVTRKALILRLTPVAVEMGWRKGERRANDATEGAYVEWKQVGDTEWRLSHRHLHTPYEEALRIYQKIDATKDVRMEAQNLMDEILKEWRMELGRREEARRTKDIEDLAFARRMAGLQKGEET